MRTYEEWLEDNEYEDTEARREEWERDYCQFCGNSHVYGPCGCDHHVRY